MKKYTHEKAHEEIDYIFKTLLPQRGMAERPEQIRLCHSILDAMLDGSIALCDAGTGIGKTFAYLTAGILHGKCRAAEGKPQRPILISTSSIALQSAIQKEYLPLLSSVLLSEGLISAPIEAVIRKGKAHYACDARLERRIRQVEGSHKNPAARQALHTAWHVLDLDQLSGMSSYDRERICVPKRCNCRRKDCRYRCFLDACQSGQYTVQICNHNLLLAALIHRSQKKKSILPDSAAIIIDEAHKLPETARQMFGVTLNAQDFAELIRSLHVERYVLAAELLSEAVEPLAEKLSLPVEEGAGFDAYQMFLERPHQVLTVICRQLEGLLTRETWRLLSAVASTVSLFYLGNPEMIFYAADDDHGGSMLCGTVSELAAQLQATLWRQEQPIVLTSGTLAVGKDFSRFRTAAGLTGERPVTETVCPSPFDYLFPVCHGASRYCGRHHGCRYHRLELYRGIGFQYAGSGGRHQDERPAGAGTDGTWLIPQVVNMDDTAAVAAGLAHPLDQNFLFFFLAPAPLHDGGDFPHQGVHPGQNRHCQQDVPYYIGQRVVGVVPVAQQRRYHQRVQQRDGQTEHRGQAEQDGQDQDPGSQENICI